MPETVDTKPEARLHLDRETLTFTRTDGKTTTVSLLELLDDPAGGEAGALAWALLMQTQGLMEFAEILATQQAKMIEAQGAMVVAIQQLTALAGKPGEMPDVQKIIGDVYAQLGISPEIVAAAMRGATAAPGVSVEKPGANGGEPA